MWVQGRNMQSGKAKYIPWINWKTSADWGQVRGFWDGIADTVIICSSRGVRGSIQMNG